MRLPDLVAQLFANERRVNPNSSLAEFRWSYRRHIKVIFATRKVDDPTERGSWVGALVADQSATTARSSSFVETS